MGKEAVCARIQEIGIIPAIRVSSTEDGLFAAEAVCSSGIPIVEVTMTVPGAVKIIQTLAKQNPGLIVGAGTVADVESGRRCLDAGALFITTTGFEPEVVQFAMRRNICVFPGVLTPSEIMMAWRAGVDFLKVFPCSAVGGPNYIRALSGPFPHIRFIAAGGVNQKTVADYISAGVAAVGIGQDLVHQDAIRKHDRDWIRELSRRYAAIIRQTREERHQMPAGARPVL